VSCVCPMSYVQQCKIFRYPPSRLCNSSTGTMKNSKIQMDSCEREKENESCSARNIFMIILFSKVFVYMPSGLLLKELLSITTSWGERTFRLRVTFELLYYKV